MAYTTYSLYLEAQVEFGLTVLGLHGPGVPTACLFHLAEFCSFKG